jgi:dUTP pyrophosphatase
MKARIRRLDPSVPLPAYQTAASAGFDIAAAESVRIESGEVRLVRTGLVVQAPDGYFLALVVRSSLPLKKGLTLANNIGVVDADYSGPEDEIKVELLNLTAVPVEVVKGERLVQGIFLPVRQVEWQEIDRLEGESRGGFGSSGGYDPGEPRDE